MDTNICKHSYYLTPNTLPDTEGTYRGVYVSNGTETLDDVAGLMASRSGMDPAAVKLVVRSMYGKAAAITPTSTPYRRPPSPAMMSRNFAYRLTLSSIVGFL